MPYLPQIETIRCYCAFCGVELHDFSLFPPSCDCPEAVKDHEGYIAELEAASPRMTPEEFELKHPLVFKERHNNVSLEVRANHPDKMMEICSHWPNEADEDPLATMGLCLDLTEKDGLDLLALLLEFFHRT